MLRYNRIRLHLNVNTLVFEKGGGFVVKKVAKINVTGHINYVRPQNHFIKKFHFKNFLNRKILK